MADDTTHSFGPLDEAARIRIKGDNGFVLLPEDALDTPEGAEAAVRAYLGRLNDFKREAIKAPALGKHAPAFVAKEAEAEAERFLSVGGAAANARQFYRITEGDDRTALEAAFATISANYLQIVAADEAGQLTDEEVRFRLDALVTEAVCGLLGLPLDDTPSA